VTLQICKVFTILNCKFANRKIPLDESSRTGVSYLHRARGDTEMTLPNRKATSAYLIALNNMSNTRPGVLAKMADRMAGDAFDESCYHGFEQPSPDAMMGVETAIFVALCDANGVDWRCLEDFTQ
jgi:hypothetical protein